MNLGLMTGSHTYRKQALVTLPLLVLKDSVRHWVLLQGMSRLLDWRFSLTYMSKLMVRFLTDLQFALLRQIDLCTQRLESPILHQ